MHSGRDRKLFLIKIYHRVQVSLHEWGLKLGKFDPYFGISVGATG
jgi:hypothetical protein